MVTKTRLVFCLFAAAAITAISLGAHAAGVSTHYEMTDRAVEQVRTPELKALLKSNRPALMCGVSFPDFGTAMDYGTLHLKKVDYGKVAHGPEFVEAYFDHVKEKCAPSYNGCDKLAAHFLGVAAHGMEDDLYDELFMSKAKLAEPKAAGKHDLWADEVFVVRYDFFDVTPRYYLPKDDLAKAYERLGMNVPKKDLTMGRGYHWLGAAGLRGLAPLFYPTWSRRMPFTRDYIVVHEGGIDYTAKKIARYLEIVWARLHGAPSANEMILATWPEPDAAEHETDRESLYSRAAVFFTTGVDQKTVTPDSVYMENASGERVPVRFHTGNQTDNFVSLIPRKNLDPGAAYTVTVTPEVKTILGDSLAGDFTFTFTTRD